MDPLTGLTHNLGIVPTLVFYPCMKDLPLSSAACTRPLNVHPSTHMAYHPNRLVNVGAQDNPIEKFCQNIKRRL